MAIGMRFLGRGELGIFELIFLKYSVKLKCQFTNFVFFEVLDPPKKQEREFNKGSDQVKLLILCIFFRK